MSISRVNSGGWAIGDKLTVAQANGLDLNGTYAADKRAGTDTISCDWTMASGASITYASGAGQAHNSGASCTFASGSTLTISNAATISGAGAKISTASSGRFELGDSDYVKFAVGHPATAHIVQMAAAETRCLDNITVDVGGFLLSTTGGIARMFFRPPKGSVLATMAVWWRPATTHTGLPAVFPSIEVFRHPTGTFQTPDALRAAGAQFYTTGDLSAYNNGADKTITYTCDQNNTTEEGYAYAVRFVDESSTNSLNGARIFQFVANYTLTDHRPY